MPTIDVFYENAKQKFTINLEVRTSALENSTDGKYEYFLLLWTNFLSDFGNYVIRDLTDVPPGYVGPAFTTFSDLIKAYIDYIVNDVVLESSSSNSSSSSTSLSEVSVSSSSSSSSVDSSSSSTSSSTSSSSTSISSSSSSSSSTSSSIDSSSSTSSSSSSSNFDADNIWTANVGANSVTRLYHDGYTRTDYSSGFNTPSSVALDTMGNVWVSNYGAGTISKLDANNPNIKTDYAVTISPLRIAVDLNDDVWAVDDTIGTNNVIQLVASSGYTSQNTYSAGTDPRSIAVDSNNDIWVINTDVASNVAQLVASSGYATINYYTVATNNLNGIAIASNNDVWICATNGTNNGIQMVAIGGYTTINFFTFGNSGQAIAIDSSDDVWITDFPSNAVVQKTAISGYTLGGAYAVGSQPDGLAVDSDDNIWVANSGSSTVSMLDASNSYAKTDYAVGSAPVYVAARYLQNILYTGSSSSSSSTSSSSTSSSIDSSSSTSNSSSSSSSHHLENSYQVLLCNLRDGEESPYGSTCLTVTQTSPAPFPVYEAPAIGEYTLRLEWLYMEITPYWQISVYSNFGSTFEWAGDLQSTDIIDPTCSQDPCGCDMFVAPSVDPTYTAKYWVLESDEICLDAMCCYSSSSSSSTSSISSSSSSSSPDYDIEVAGDALTAGGLSSPNGGFNVAGTYNSRNWYASTTQSTPWVIYHVGSDIWYLLDYNAPGGIGDLGTDGGRYQAGASPSEDPPIGTFNNDAFYTGTATTS